MRRRSRYGWLELIEGITLKSYILKKGHLGVKETIGIAIQVAQGLALPLHMVFLLSSPEFQILYFMQKQSAISASDLPLLW